MSFIETFTGLTFDPLNPVVADIRIEDIAHALSNQCRYSGHCRVFYSVAEHSVRVAETLWNQGRPMQLWGLLHDASEAYLVDLPRPLKETANLGYHYHVAEDRVMAAIAERFKLAPTEPAAVRIADDILLATEVRDLMHGDRPYWQKIKAEPLPERIEPWGSKFAEHKFLKVFEALSRFT